MASPFPFTSGQVLTAAQLNAIGEWTAFTPSWNNFTPGNATEDWAYTIVNEVMVITGRTTLGTTSSMGTAPSMTLPDSKTANRWCMALLVFRNFGSATYTGAANINGPADTDILLQSHSVSGSNVVLSSINATAPFTWNNGDYFTFTIAVDISS